MWKLAMCAVLCLSSCNMFGASWQEFQVDLSETLSTNAALQASINQEHQESITASLDAYASGEMSEEEMRLRQEEANKVRLTELQEAFGLLSKETGEDLEEFKESLQDDVQGVKETISGIAGKAAQGPSGWLEIAGMLLGTGALTGAGVNWSRNRNIGTQGKERSKTA